MINRRNLCRLAAGLALSALTFGCATSKEFEGRLVFRLPVIPGFNDSKEHIDSIISFIKETGKDEINLLPLHHLGREKYQLLDKEYCGGKYPAPSDEILRNIREVFTTSGKCMYQAKFTGNETSIQTADWQPGIYFVKVSSGRESRMERLVVVK